MPKLGITVDNALVHSGDGQYNRYMTRLVQFVPNEFYHIYNRGTNKMEIFNLEHDYIRFQKLLYLLNSKATRKFSDVEQTKLSLSPVWTVERGETLVDIGAYTLMPNHFHLLIKVKEGVDASMFLQRLLGSHSKYFNVKYQRTGTLFEGKSKSKHAGFDRYLKYIFSYIHLNIIKLFKHDWKEEGIGDTGKAIEFLDNYKYSSYPDYAGFIRPENAIINKSAFPEYFTNPKEHMDELLDWLTFNKNEK